jgi:enoyl-CoA hydratase/carnithine racemase
MHIEVREALRILWLGDGENRVDAGFLASWAAALDEVEADASAASLITAGEGRFYSNGYDLGWMASRSREEQRRFVQAHQALLARVLLFPVPTAAALNGHAIGGGALLALAHDVRVMRSDRGFFCLPEIDAGIAFRPGMIALLRCRLSASTLRDAALAGARFGAHEAQRLGIVDAEAEAGDLMQRAGELLGPLSGRPRKSLSDMKRALYADVAEALRSSPLRQAPGGREGSPGDS